MPLLDRLIPYALFGLLVGCAVGQLLNAVLS